MASLFSFSFSSLFPIKVFQDVASREIFHPVSFATVFSPPPPPPLLLFFPPPDKGSGPARPLLFFFFPFTAKAKRERDRRMYACASWQALFPLPSPPPPFFPPSPRKAGLLKMRLSLFFSPFFCWARSTIEGRDQIRRRFSHPIGLRPFKPPASFFFPLLFPFPFFLPPPPP